MKKIGFLNLCICMLAIHVYSASSVRQNIDNVCSLTFPAAPHMAAVHGRTEYLYETDSCSYLVQIIPITESNMIHDSAGLAKFYKGTVKGIIRAASGSEIGHKDIDVSGLAGEDLEYTRGGDGHPPVSIRSRIVVLKDHLVIYSFTAPYSRFATMKEAMGEFFASFSKEPGRPVKETLARLDAGAAIPVTADSASTVPIGNDALSPVQPIPVHTDLVRSNTLRFIISFAACISLLAFTLYGLVRWKKRNTNEKSFMHE
jgi:hypothetical protein